MPQSGYLFLAIERGLAAGPVEASYARIRRLLRSQKRGLYLDCYKQNGPPGHVYRTFIPFILTCQLLSPDFFGPLVALLLIGFQRLEIGLLF